MLIPNSILIVLSAVGLIHLSVHLINMGKYGVHYLKFKQFPLTKEEETISLLREDLRQKNQKIETLEQETEKMTLALLKHLS